MLVGTNDTAKLTDSLPFRIVSRMLLKMVRLAGWRQGRRLPEGACLLRWRFAEGWMLRGLACAHNITVGQLDPALPSFCCPSAVLTLRLLFSCRSCSLWPPGQSRQRWRRSGAREPRRCVGYVRRSKPVVPTAPELCRHLPSWRQCCMAAKRLRVVLLPSALCEAQLPSTCLLCLPPVPACLACLPAAGCAQGSQRSAGVCC